MKNNSESRVEILRHNDGVLCGKDGCKFKHSKDNKYCNKHPVDSVDAPINGTIGNKSVQIIIEGIREFMDEKTVILDLGSGNGKTSKPAIIFDSGLL